MFLAIEVSRRRYKSIFLPDGNVYQPLLNRISTEFASEERTLYLKRITIILFFPVLHLNFEFPPMASNDLSGDIGRHLPVEEAKQMSSVVKRNLHISRARKVIHASFELRPVKHGTAADDSVVCTRCLQT